MGAGVRVLVVDDDPAMVTLLETAFELDERCAVVATANDGLAAIARAAEHHPDVIVLDAMMPELGGIEAIPGIRAVSRGSRIVVFSAATTDDSAALAVHLGASAVIGKTEPIKTLLDAVASLASVAPGGGAAGGGGAAS